MAGKTSRSIPSVSAATNSAQDYPKRCTFAMVAKKLACPHNPPSHLQTHAGERSFACVACGKSFVRRHDYKRHERIHYDHSEAGRRCIIPRLTQGRARYEEGLELKPTPKTISNMIQERNADSPLLYTRLPFNINAYLPDAVVQYQDFLTQRNISYRKMGDIV